MNSRTVRVIATFLLLLCMPSCGGGKNIGQALDDLEGKIASLAGQLGSTAGLTELNLLNTLQMKVNELRVQWKDILGDSIASLDLEQQKTLDTISQAATKAQDLVDSTTRLEDLGVLDVTVLMSKAGLAKTDEIRRVTPAAQAHKNSGIYTYMVTLPLFGTGNKINAIKFNDIDVTQWKQDNPPHTILLNIPQDKIEQAFDDWKLNTARLEVALTIPQPWWKPWKKPINETLVINTGLFPRHPLRYWFAEHPHVWEIDQDPSHLQIVNSVPTLIPGCGTSGCYLSYNVCAAAPVGSQMVGDTFNYQDSFNGWGSFVPPPRVSDNTICLTYLQHSHNQNRSVWFSAHYRPQVKKELTQYFTLSPLAVDAIPAGQSVAEVPQKMGGLIKAPGNIADQQLREIQKMASQLQLLSPIVSITQALTNQLTTVQSALGAPSNGSPDPIPNPTYQPPNGDTGPTPRPMDFGRTYFVAVDREVNWELVVQAFTGETITLSPTVLAPADKQPHVISARTETNRLRFDATPPW